MFLPLVWGSGGAPTALRDGAGTRLGLTGNGILCVDGKEVKGAVPNLGKDIFVDSVTGSDNSDGLTPDRALATLDAAFAKCTANKGYQIFVLPLHAETVTGAAGTPSLSGLVGKMAELTVEESDKGGLRLRK